MRRTLAEIWKELNSMRHDVAVLLLFLILPLFQVYAWATSPSLVPYGLTVAVQDLDRTPLSQEYTDGIRAALSCEVISLGPDMRYEPLRDRGEARGAGVIPENFQRDFYAGKTVEVQWVIEGTQLKAAGKVKSGAAGVTNYVMSKYRPPGGSPPSSRRCATGSIPERRASTFTVLELSSLASPSSRPSWWRSPFRANLPKAQQSACLPRT